MNQSSASDTLPEPPVWRLLQSGWGEPAWNMALDEALLEAYRPGDPPILRFYGWRPAALSLGRFQPAADVSPPPGATLVRRITGGSAIHHREDEVTYAVVAPYALFGRSPRAAYHAIHRAIAAGLAELGVAAGARPDASPRARPAGLCFAQPTDYDLLAQGRKLVGSAQRRRRTAFLQHGSLPLSPDPRAEGATSLTELLGAPPARHAVIGAISDALRATSGRVKRYEEAQPEPAERALAGRLQAERYGAAAWTFDR